MAHTPKEKLEDLADILERIRALAGIKEPKPAIFYLKSKPFLHFHDKDNERWADVKDGASWGSPLMIPFAATKPQREKFYAAVLKRYQVVVRKGTP